MRGGILAWAAAAATLGLSGQAMAQGDAAPASSAAAPSQAKKPLRYYPERAQAAARPGRVVMTCVITEAGSVRDCTVVSEDPPGFGFGDKALEMSSLFKYKPGSFTPGQRVSIPIAFKLGS